MKPTVAVIGTGGTIASLASSPLELLDYEPERGLAIDNLLARFPVFDDVATIIPVPYKTVSGYRIFFPDWQQLVALCARLERETPGLSGIVITHGTSSLEETAYFLNLTLKVAVPVVLVGAQRPASALSSDAGLNLVNAVRVAGSEIARGLGVLVVMNREIHAARDVTKGSTMGLEAFQSPDTGPLGFVDGDRISLYRRPERQSYPKTEFDIEHLECLPRVDIQYAYAGSDGVAVRAFVAAGARGIISAGFAPGFPGAGDADALLEAAESGVIVVQSTRVERGRTVLERWARDAGFLTADNLSPQKARILLALSLSKTRLRDAIASNFITF